MSSCEGAVGEAAPPPARGRRRLAVIVVILTVVAVAGFTVYWFFMRPPAVPWLFKGAYAKYHGEASILFMTVKLDMRLEVVDYNSTHVKILMYMKMDTPLGSREFQNVTWSSLTGKSYGVEGSKLKRVYEQEVFVEGFGTRKCVIYEYESSSERIIVYVDKETAWPIKITFTFENMPGVSIDLKITESNIPGLKK
jgi:hypothetical protein